MKKVTTYTELGRSFVIARDDEGFFWAIEDKYIDGNGKLKKSINGLEGHRGETMEWTISTLSNEIQTVDLVKKGWHPVQASIFVTTGKLIPVEQLQGI